MHRLVAKEPNTARTTGRYMTSTGPTTDARNTREPACPSNGECAGRDITRQERQGIHLSFAAFALLASWRESPSARVQVIRPARASTNTAQLVTELDQLPSPPHLHRPPPKRKR